jgi:hypothetical protein
MRGGGLSRKNEPYPDQSCRYLRKSCSKLALDAIVNDRLWILRYRSPQAAMHNDNLALVRKLLAAGRRGH